MGVWAGKRPRAGAVRPAAGKGGNGGNTILFTIFFLFLALCLHEERMRALDLASPDFASDRIRPASRTRPLSVQPAGAPPLAIVPVERASNPVAPALPHVDRISQPVLPAPVHVDRVMQPEPAVDGDGDDDGDPNPGKTATEALRPHNSAPMPKARHLQPLRRRLGFSRRTKLNFMHFHKTGGVSFKIALFSFFMRKRKDDGQRVRVRDACYKVEKNGKVNWRCDWMPLWKMSAAERAKIDVFFGHQYREHGVEHFLKGQDVRTFTVMRHPFARKVSFFFHFFVRALGRKENKVPFSELRDFLLYEKIPPHAEAGWDIGPNYMAGRMLSTDVSDFIGDRHRRHFEVRAEDVEGVMAECKNIVDGYVFVGLQSESEASKCMLMKTVMAFNEAHGIDNSNVEKLAEHIPHTNAGSYKMTSGKAWAKLTAQERKIFNHAERVDLAIYYEGEKQFKKQVRFFGCDHLVKKIQLQEA